MNTAQQPRAPHATPADDVEIITFGCRLNAFESEVMRQAARDAGLTNAVIVNTCAVTAEAERQARQAIRRARRARKDVRLIVTGCAAQIDPQAYARLPEVDEVIGNAEKLTSRSFAPHGEPVRVNDIQSVRETAGHLVTGFAGRARAFLQVQNGCDHRCTFCIIPFGRGPSRSVAVGEVVAQARDLVTAGFREVVLTGVDIGAYGLDLPGQPGLGKLVEQVLHHVPDLARLRLTSIDAVEVDDRLFDLFADEPRLMPHLHLSLQAGDDLILKRMKRRHTRDDAIGLCARLAAARPGMVFGADLIAGFPTETEAAFQRSLDIIGECGLTHLHVFPYSERADTPATRMPPVPVAVRKERAARLRQAGEAALGRYLESRVGRREHVLAETRAGGRTEGYARVRLDGAPTPGTVVAAHVTGHDGTHLTAKVLDG